jgi:hypothetical protein
MTTDPRIQTSISVGGVCATPVVAKPDAIRLDGPDIKRKRLRQVLDWIWIIQPNSTPRRWWLPLAGIVFVVGVLYLTVYREYIQEQKRLSGAITKPDSNPWTEFDENGKLLNATKPDPEPWKK